MAANNSPFGRSARDCWQIWQDYQQAEYLMAHLPDGEALPQGLYFHHGYVVYMKYTAHAAWFVPLWLWEE